jgi:hypothetical protein
MALRQHVELLILRQELHVDALAHRLSGSFSGRLAAPRANRSIGEGERPIRETLITSSLSAVKAEAGLLAARLGKVRLGQLTGRREGG